MRRPGAYIVGMHRSGTSAVARIVNLLGVPIGDAKDLIEADPPSNPKGHWESGSLAAFNDRLLATLGGAWSAPPQMPPQWEAYDYIGALGGEAIRAFDAVYGSKAWVWKDPRLCLTIPFWRRQLKVRSVALLVLRHPLEVAASLEARNGFPTAYSLALWERYNRQALLGLRGLPVLVTAFESLLQDAPGWCRQTAGFLKAAGLPASVPPSGALGEFLDPKLRHSAQGLETLESPAVSAEQRALHKALIGAAGSHASFHLSLSIDETASTARLIAAHREAVVAARNPWLVPERR